MNSEDRKTCAARQRQASSGTHSRHVPHRRLQRTLHLLHMRLTRLRLTFALLLEGISMEKLLTIFSRQSVYTTNPLIYEKKSLKYVRQTK